MPVFTRKCSPCTPLSAPSSVASLGKLPGRSPPGSLEGAGSAAPVLTYMEVGVFSGWTSVVMSAFLSRLSNRTAFRAAAVDIDRTHLSLGTSTLLARHKASFIFRHRLQPWLDATPLIDLCFIGNV